MKEFQSQLEQIVPVKELLFESTAGFGSYKKYMSHAIAHPAKMNMNLLKFLILEHTKEGDLILDPMAGTGSTGVVAALNGRNAVCVDLEKKFFDWMEKARENVEASSLLRSKGSMRNVLGDARGLSELLTEADVVLTSPPYSNAIGQQGGGAVFRGDFKVGESTITARAYSKDPSNIGNLPHGEVDAVITSPPFADGFRHNVQDKEKRLQKLIEVDKKGVEKGQKWATTSRKALERRLAMQDEGYGEKKENIGNLPFDAVITSPPYSESLNESKNTTSNLKREERLKTHGHEPKQFFGGTARNCQLEDGLRYSHDRDNIGNLKHGEVDAVITSPPYEEGLGAKAHSPVADRIFQEKGLGVYTERGNVNNIGNLKKETYLEAMLRVYSEMHKILKPEGLAIIVVKPFIRNKKVVDLPWHTWMLLQKVGFKLTKLYKLRLKNQSFWRILYNKKYPDVELIAHEYVLVCQKQPFSLCV